MFRRNMLLWFSLVVAATWFAWLSFTPSRALEPRLHNERRALTSDEGATLAKLDAWYRAEWGRQQLQPAAQADALMLVRRLSLALTGTVPSLEEIRALEKLPADEQLDAWVEHLLRDSRCHDYLAERLARSYVGVKEGAFVLFRRRRFVSWLSDQLASNRPYDALAREVISSEGLWTDRPATNFVTASIKPNQNRSQPDEKELASRVARAFLGVRIDCAECHDHPFDRWKQADFQGLAAFFAPAQLSFRGIRDIDEAYQVEDLKTGAKQTIAARVPFDDTLLPAVDRRQNARSRLASWVTHPDNTHFSRAIVNRVWALLLGQGLVQPIDDIREGELPEPLEILAADFAAHGFQLRRLVRLIAHSQPFLRDSRADFPLTEAHTRAGAAFPLTRLRSEQIAGGVLQAATLHTLDRESHWAVRFGRFNSQNDFIKRYGDAGEDELNEVDGTIAQRLLMMNGKLVSEKLRRDQLLSTVNQIAELAPDNARAIEIAYLTVLTRRPTETEREHFLAELSEVKGNQRQARLADVMWSLLNSVEFAWNH